MPIYEYRCGACDHHLEALQKMTDSPLRKCPQCGKSQLKRLVSASQFRLKGSGWYETDFKNKGEAKRNLVEHAATDSGETASSTTTDTAAKVDAGKAVAAEKSADTAEKPAAKTAKKPVSEKPAAAASKSASKPRAKAARR
jgi:putative FmdB family regulatory protein